MNKILSCVVALFIISAGFSVADARGPQGETGRETAFARVMKTQTLRCAYISRPNHFETDASTGQRKGIDYEIMEEAGRLLNLKIVWAEETGYGAYAEQLNSGKEDALCTTIWANTALASRVLFSTPLIYSQPFAYVRAGDTRFDGHIEKLNDEKYSVAVIDGSALKAIADKGFPRARQIAAPQLSDDSLLMQDVIQSKADAGFFLGDIVARFNKNNPGKPLKRVLGAGPVKVFPEVFAVAMGEFELREFLNVAMTEMHNNGTIERIIRKYETTPGEYARVRPAYATGE